MPDSQATLNREKDIGWLPMCLVCCMGVWAWISREKDGWLPMCLVCCMGVWVWVSRTHIQARGSAHICTLSARRALAGRWIPGTHWPAGSLVKSKHSRLSKRPCLKKKIRQKEMEEETWCWPLASTCTHMTWMFMWILPYNYVHTVYLYTHGCCYKYTPTLRDCKLCFSAMVLTNNISTELAKDTYTDQWDKVEDSDINLTTTTICFLTEMATKLFTGKKYSFFDIWH